jgi:hypothetical protein
MTTLIHCIQPLLRTEGQNTSNVVLRVVQYDEKESRCLGAGLVQPVTGGHTCRNLVVQIVDYMQG